MANIENIPKQPYIDYEYATLYKQNIEKLYLKQDGEEQIVKSQEIPHESDSQSEISDNKINITHVIEPIENITNTRSLNPFLIFSLLAGVIATGTTIAITS